MLGNSSTTSSCVLKRGSSCMNSIWLLSIPLLTAARSSIPLLTAGEVKHIPLLTAVRSSILL